MSDSKNIFMNEREKESAGEKSGVRSMKIEKVIIKNFRNIEDLEKEIGGANILLIGENAVGKSNFIKAIEIALGMTERIGEDPVMKGKKDSLIQVITDDEDGKKYEFQVKLKAGSDKAYISVKAPDGLRANTKSIIGGIVGEIDFDIDRFIELSSTVKGRKDQVDIVRSFLSDEIKDYLLRHEMKLKNLYDDRTEINREIKSIEGFIQQSGFNPLDFDKYIKREDVKEKIALLDQAIELNQDIQRGNQTRNELDKKISMNVKECEALKLKIDSLEKDNEEHMQQIIKIDRWLRENKPIDVKALQDEIQKANEFNSNFEKIDLIRKQEEKLKAARDQAGDLTAQYESTQQAIHDTIRDMEMPIEGLSFDSEKLYYNGIAVDESTLSTSEIMMLGAKLKIAKAPNAKVLFIQRGESLGLKKLKDLQKMAKDHGFQIIMEQMQRGVQDLVIELMPE